MTGQLYIESVIDHVPHGLPLRQHIALELQSHIAERTQQGYPLDEIVRQLGDPLTLAESYLAAVPLESASISRRVAAKLIDVAAVVGAVLTFVVMLWFVVPVEVRYFLPVAGILICVFTYGVYSAGTEYHFGWTLGKHLMNIIVVRESGDACFEQREVVRVAGDQRQVPTTRVLPGDRTRASAIEDRRVAGR